MIVALQTQALRTLEQIRSFLEGNEALEFATPERKMAYKFASQDPPVFRLCARLSKAEFDDILDAAKSHIAQARAAFREALGEVPPEELWCARTRRSLGA